MSAFFLVIILFFFGLVVFSMAGGIFMYHSIFVRKVSGKGALDKEPVKGSNSLLSHLQDQRIMIPLIEAKKRWDSYDIEETCIVSFDGTMLKGYFWESAIDAHTTADNKAAPLAFLVHGFTDSAAGMSYLAETYRAHGFAVFAVDCRSHGASGGKTLGMGYTDSKDIVEWMKYIKTDKRICNRHIILHGVSMGAAAVLLYCGTSYAQHASSLHKAHPCLVVADSGFSSYYKESFYQLSRIMKGPIIQAVLRSALVFAASLICLIKNGFSFGRISPRRALRRATLNGFNTNLILFHGGKDTMVPPEHCTDLFETYNKAQKKCKKNEKTSVYSIKMCIMEAAPHIGAYFYEPERYFEIIMKIYYTYTGSISKKDEPSQ